MLFHITVKRTNFDRVFWKKSVLKINAKLFSIVFNLCVWQKIGTSSYQRNLVTLVIVSPIFFCSKGWSKFVSQNSNVDLI